VQREFWSPLDCPETTMHPLVRLSPLLVVLAATGAMLLHGPIAQLAHYHEFADVRPGLGFANIADVLSNLGFLLVGGWGLWRLTPRAGHPTLAAGWAGYRLFLVALVLTAGGSAWYHLAPDDARLIWDRLPIALACAGLLAGVAGETSGASARRWAIRLSLIAALSVAWWHATGDLRPYLLLQGLPLLLVPLWQAIHRAPAADRRAFGLALALYAAAKLAELNDHAVFEALGWISGHTLKHLLASAAAATVTWRLASRKRAAEEGRSPSLNCVTSPAEPHNAPRASR
jgi:hypothetical protein